jgi:hypothetical protein
VILLKIEVKTEFKSYYLMRRLLTVVILLLPLSTLLSQPQLTHSKTIDTRLLEVFEKEYLETVRVDDAFLFERWHFYLDNAYFISDSPLSKNDKEDYPSVSIADLSKINILKLEKEQNLKHDYFIETIYKIEGTQKFLVYYSGRDFIEKFNTHWNDLKK